MIKALEIVLQYTAIACFVGLTITSLVQGLKDIAGLNFALTLLYVFLYLHPFGG